MDQSETMRSRSLPADPKTWSEQAGRWLTCAAQCTGESAEVELIREFSELLNCAPSGLLERLAIQFELPQQESFLDVGATETIVHRLLGMIGGGYMMSKGADHRFIATFCIPNNVPETHFSASRAALALAGAMLRSAFDICTNEPLPGAGPLRVVKD